MAAASSSNSPLASDDDMRPHPAQPLAGESPVMAVEQQGERALVYGGLAALLGTAGLGLAVFPAQAVEYLWLATPGAVVTGLTRTLGGFVVLAAICAKCLKVRLLFFRSWAACMLFVGGPS